MASSRTAPGPHMDLLLTELWQAGGTDLLLTVGLPPQVRVHGALRAVPNEAALAARDTEALLAELLTAE